MDKKKFGMISLGCDKNRVDGERLLGEIKRRGHIITDDAAEAQVLIVNTCAFLNAARKEAIETALECDGYRKNGKLEKLVVAGCLPKKYIGELFPSLTEADVFLGVDDAPALFDALEKSYAGERVNAVGACTGACFGDRVVTTPSHLKYLKIADGCSNHCTYCLIPSIRGKYTSYSEEQLLAEARALGHTEELVLVAQDTTRYGEDEGENKFVSLLKKLSQLDNVCHIRLLYCYPDRISEELIFELKNNPKLVKYLDIPLQHSEERVLRLMGRKGGRREFLALFARLREEVPGIALRTTFISGFPTETEEEHGALVSFLREAQLDNCGFFAYSREEGTPAYKLKGQVPAAVKKRRVKELYAAQSEISAQKLMARVGESLEVLCDGIDYEKSCFFGRAYFQAPEIDGVVYFTGARVTQGQFYRVKIDRADEYDLYGHIE